MILTLASPRTVSTRIHSILCDYHKAKNLREAFNYFNFENAGTEKAGYFEKQKAFFQEQRVERYKSIPPQWHKKQLLQMLASRTEIGVKIFPGHLKRTPLIFENLISNARITEAVIIIRKDINAQLQSWYRARYTGHWGHGSSYPDTIHIPWNQLEYDRLKRTVIDHYKTLAEWYKQVPDCKWMWSEDAMTGEPQHQPHTLEREFPIIEDDHLEQFELDPAQQLDFGSIVTRTSHLAHP